MCFGKYVAAEATTPSRLTLYVSSSAAAGRATLPTHHAPPPTVAL